MAIGLWKSRSGRGKCDGNTVKALDYQALAWPSATRLLVHCIESAVAGRAGALCKHRSVVGCHLREVAVNYPAASCGACKSAEARWSARMRLFPYTTEPTIGWLKAALAGISPARSLDVERFTHPTAGCNLIRSVVKVRKPYPRLCASCLDLTATLVSILAHFVLGRKEKTALLPGASSEVSAPQIL